MHPRTCFRFALATALGLLSFGASASPYVIGGMSYTLSTPAETVIAPFNSPSGGLTVSQYSGMVLLVVSGTGASEGATLGDAFYRNFGAPAHDANYYQLVVTTDASVAGNGVDDAYRQLVYDVDAGIEVSKPYTPAYRPDHIYRFILDLSLQSPPTPAQLRFGVNDGGYGDNGPGVYNIQVTQLSAEPVPEASTWMAGAGLAVVLGAMWWRARQRAATA